MEGGILYLVFVEPDAGLDPAPGLRPLGGGLYLAASAHSRSQLHHALKRKARPARLLVAPLADAPKFMGMAPGALAWLRKLQPDPGAAAQVPGPPAGAGFSAPAKPAARKPARRRR